MANEEEVEVEEEVVEETVEETPVVEETTTKEEPVVEKPTETLEDRRARLMRQLDQTNKKLGIETDKTPKKASKSNDLDYGQKAFLAASGIKGAKEFEFVKNELRQSGQDLDALLENDYFKQRLTGFRELNKTSEATPTGKRSGGVATDSVEYWAAKPIEDVPQEKRADVVNYKLKKSNAKGPFYNS